MELVYLWVEDYKNIENQGFNFSTNYECEFIPDYVDGNLSDKCELKIMPKENPLENFFGENINVTALVGENGSGKSTIFEIISHLILEQDIRNNIKINAVLILKKNKEIFILNSNETNNEHHTKFNKKVKLSTDLDLSLYKDYFYRTTGLIHFFLFDDFFHFDFSNKYIEYKNKYISFKNGVQVGMEESRYKKAYDLELTLFAIAEKYIELFKLNKDYFSFLGDEFLFDYIEIKLFDDINDIKMNADLIINNNTENNLRLFFIKNKEDILDRLSDNMGINLKQINEFDKNVLLFIHEYYNSSFRNNHIIINLLCKEKKISFNELSAGEQIVTKFFIEFFYSLEKYKDRNIVFLLDEIETSLNPNWQKKVLNLIFKGLNNVDFKNLQLLISTHSPFILSDIPKENVIFLEKGKQVYPFENGQTFGANIHTLLSHGFFMKDGLMGEFAKSKIDIAIKYLNQTKLSEKEITYCEDIISIIGEPIIKRQLQKMLDSKRLSEIDVIKKQIEQLQKELATKENKK